MGGVSAYNLFEICDQERALLRSGCTSIDEILGGGFPCGLISEICGESGSGKTQLCLQLLLQAQLPYCHGGLSARSCYVTTEGLASTKRLFNLANQFKIDYPTECERFSTSDLLHNIFVERIYTIEELIETMQTRIPQLMASKNVRLIIFDSIAAALRYDHESNMDQLQKSRLMYGISNCLRILCDRHKSVCVVVNQVSGMKGSKAFRPALGLSWSNCINQRIMLAKINPYNISSKEIQYLEENYHNQWRKSDSVSHRSFHVIFSPFVASKECRFLICEGGIR